MGPALESWPLHNWVLSPIRASRTSGTSLVGTPPSTPHPHRVALDSSSDRRQREVETRTKSMRDSDVHLRLTLYSEHDTCGKGYPVDDPESSFQLKSTCTSGRREGVRKDRGRGRSRPEPQGQDTGKSFQKRVDP